jgi:hypothetical protein
MAANYTFGVGGDRNGIAVESESYEDTNQFVAEAKNTAGVVDAVKLGAGTGTCTISGYLKGSLPSINDVISIGGRSFYCDKVSSTSTNTDFVKAEITGKFWDGV